MYSDCSLLSAELIFLADITDIITILPFVSRSHKRKKRIENTDENALIRSGKDTIIVQVLWYRLSSQEIKRSSNILSSALPDKFLPQQICFLLLLNIRINSFKVSPFSFSFHFFFGFNANIFLGFGIGKFIIGGWAESIVTCLLSSSSSQCLKLFYIQKPKIFSIEFIRTLIVICVGVNRTKRFQPTCNPHKLYLLLWKKY